MLSALRLFSLLIFSGLLVLSGCGPAPDTDQPALSATKTATDAPAPVLDWAIFRGDPQLSGNTPSPLPDAVERLWTFATQGSIKSSPVISDSRVFIGSSDAFLYALDLATGAKLWSFKTGKAIEAPPLCFADKVFVPSTDGTLYALRASDGALLWKHATGEPLLGSANIVYARNQAYVIVGSYDNTLYCLNIETGKVRWAYATDNFINGSPSVQGDQIAFGGCDSQFHLVSAASGKKIVSLEIGSYVAGSAALSGRLAVVGNYAGILTCIDLEKRKIHWTRDLDGSAIIVSPAVNETVTVIGSRDKKVHCFDLQDGTPRWSFTTRGNVDSSPLIGGQRVLAASADGWLYCLNLADGKEIWSYQVGAALTGSPAFAQGKIIIGAEDGTVYSFGSLEN